MSPEEFLQWCLHQEGRWELVDGRPVQVLTDLPDLPLELMAGATKKHGQIVVNLIAALKVKLKGRSCRAPTADIAARMRNGNMRRPDVTIDCKRGRGEDTESAEPTVFFEVLSPSTQSIDFIVKAEEYKRSRVCNTSP